MFSLAEKIIGSVLDVVGNLFSSVILWISKSFNIKAHVLYLIKYDKCYEYVIIVCYDDYYHISCVVHLVKIYTVYSSKLCFF